MGFPKQPISAMTLMSLLIKTFRLKSRDQLIALEVTLFLLASRMMVKCLPFPILRIVLGKHMHSQKNIRIDEKTVRRVSCWINKVAPHLPCQCNCLPKAITGKLMLKLRKINSTLYLGLGKDTKTQLVAHAWLMVDDIPVTGGNINNNLTKISYFG